MQKWLRTTDLAVWMI